MKFWYTKLRANPQLTSSGKPWVYVPLVDIDLFTSDRIKSNFKYRVLVDSGADTCLFHGAVGETLGLNVKSGRKSPMKGVTSKEGEVFVSGEDALGLYTARGIIKAIGRGFSPEHALRLLNDDCLFELIELEEILGKNKSRMLKTKTSDHK